MLTGCWLALWNPTRCPIPRVQERQGAATDAWLDPAKWAAHFADGLVAKVTEAATRHPKFTGRYIGTAMNHRCELRVEQKRVCTTFLARHPKRRPHQRPMGKKKEKKSDVY